MTEREWLQGSIPEPLLMYLSQRTTERKLRLFACACASRIVHLLSDDRSRNAIDAAERFADARTNPERQAIKIARSEAINAEHADENSYPVRVARAVAGRSASEAARRVSHYIAWGISDRRGELLPEWEQQVHLIRCVFGNPFLSVKVVADWNAWSDCTVPRIAAAIYQDKAFDRLPILADALEDAGCDNADILSHCRGPGPHVRGCWVVDLLLGKG